MLREVDSWFASVRARHAGEMQCGRGCCLCCYGLFDISVPDALEVAEAFDALPVETRAAVSARAAEVQTAIEREAPELRSPYLLDILPEERIDAIVDNARTPRCPFLGERNECLIYEKRPIACRVEGAPMVDIHDGLFGDWCELNFTSGVPDSALRDLEPDYYGMQEIEHAAAESISQSLRRGNPSEITVFIPSLIVEFDRFWKPVLERLRKRKAKTATDSTD